MGKKVITQGEKCAQIKQRKDSLNCTGNTCLLGNIQRGIPLRSCLFQDVSSARSLSFSYSIFWSRQPLAPNSEATLRIISYSEDFNTLVVSRLED